MLLKISSLAKISWPQQNNFRGFLDWGCFLALNAIRIRMKNFGELFRAHEKHTHTHSLPLIPHNYWWNHGFFHEYLCFANIFQCYCCYCCDVCDVLHHDLVYNYTLQRCHSSEKKTKNRTQKKKWEAKTEYKSPDANH